MDRKIQFPRVRVTKIEIVVVDKTEPRKPVLMTIEIWGCYEVESKYQYKYHYVTNNTLLVYH